LKWVEVFGVPTDFTMHAIRIRSYRSYKNALNDLISWGFIRLVEKSHNQFTCNKVALILKAKATESALALKTKAANKASDSANVYEVKAEQAYINNEKMKTSKQNKRDFIPPTVEEVRKFFDENGYSPEAGEKACNYYAEAAWHDSHANPVLNWKQKMRSVWFKDENKKKVRMLA
jgi:hypothetical protein